MRKKVLIIFLVIILTGLGVLAFRKSHQANAGYSDYMDTQVPPNVKRIALEMNNLTITSGPSHIDLPLGEQVLLGITSKDAREVSIKLEGYGLRTESEAGALGEIEFTADKIGSFNLVAIPSSDEEEEQQPEEPKVLATIEVHK